MAGDWLRAAAPLFSRENGRAKDSSSPSFPAWSGRNSGGFRQNTPSRRRWEASKQALNPLANVWMMQIQQNTNWIGMPGNKGNRVQSNLQFQPLMSVKLTDDWNLITRPVIQMFRTTPFL